MKDCIFCKIIAGEIPATIEYRDDEFVAFRDIRPASPVDILVVPKQHITNLNAVDTSHVEMLGKLQVLARDLAAKLGISKAFKIGLNGGSLVEIDHLHYHLLGGFKKGGEI